MDRAHIGGVQSRVFGSNWWKNAKMTAFYKLMKFDKIFEHIRLRIQAVSSKVNIGSAEG